MTILAYDGERLRRRLAARRHWNWRRLVVFVSIVYATVISVRQVIAYEQLHGHIRQVDSSITALRLQNEQLKREIAFAKSPEYIRQAAASKLGLVPQGAMPFQPLP